MHTQCIMEILPHVQKLSWFQVVLDENLVFVSDFLISKIISLKLIV